MASIPETLPASQAPSLPPPDALPALPTDALPPPDADLIHTDGEPMDSPWHRANMNLLIEQVQYHRRNQRDYFVGGNMFIYFSAERVRNRDFRGPDFFFVRGIPYNPLRDYYAVWKEGGRYPDLIIELLSATTAVEDRTTKKEIYQNTFRSHEYFLYDPDERRLEGFRHNGTAYEPIEADARGFLWCEELGLWLGTWVGETPHGQSTWLRFFDTDGKVVPLFAEAEKARAEAEKNRAEAEESRAETAEARARAAEVEIARLKALLGDRAT